MDQYQQYMGMAGMPANYYPMMQMPASQLESMYPRCYFVIYPKVKRMCDMYCKRYGDMTPTPEMLQQMVDNVYDEVEPMMQEEDMAEVEAAAEEMPMYDNMPNFGTLPASENMPNYGMLPTSENMPNYGMMPASENMPNFGTLPASEEMPGFEKMPKTAQMPAAEEKMGARQFGVFGGFRPRRRFLRDLITILFIRNLLGRRRRPFFGF